MNLQLLGDIGSVKDHIVSKHLNGSKVKEDTLGNHSMLLDYALKASSVIRSLDESIRELLPQDRPNAEEALPKRAR